MQSVHLLNRVVYPGDEGGVRNRILCGVTILICRVDIVQDGGKFPAVLTSYPDLAKSDGFVSTVDGQDNVGLSVFYGSADGGVRSERDGCIADRGYCIKHRRLLTWVVPNASTKSLLSTHCSSLR